jgi:hypothetical protein
MNPPYIKTEIVGKGENTFYFKDEEMTIRHREDGPASEYYDGEKFYYINGRELSEQDFIRRNNPLSEV